MSKERVVYYPPCNGACGYNLELAESVLRTSLEKDLEKDINNIFELWHIKKYVEDEIYLNSWSNEDVISFKEKIINYTSIVKRFISEISSDNILALYKQLDHHYHDTFWKLVSDFKIYTNINKESFASILLLSKNIYSIQKILKQKRLVKYYSNEIKMYFLNNINSAEILLSQYIKKHDEPVAYFIPSKLTLQEKQDILYKYIESENANYNYVKVIFNMKDGVEVPDKVRYKAKKYLDKKNEEILNNGCAIRYGVQVCFKEQEQVLEIKTEGNDKIYSYSSNIIKENMDYISLFFNFKRIFLFLDNQNRFNLVKKNSDHSFLDLLGLKTLSDYNDGGDFGYINRLAHMQIQGCNVIFKREGTSVIEVLSNVCNKLISQKIANFSIATISDSLSAFEKNRIILPEIDSILKQYTFYVNDGELNLELLEMSSKAIPFGQVPSINRKKYAYLNMDNKNIKRVSSIIFGNNSIVHYIDPYKDRYNNLLDLLLNEDVKIDEFETYQKEKIDWLIENDHIYTQNNGRLKFTDSLEMLVIKDLYLNQVGSYHLYPEELQKRIDILEVKDMVIIESTLFSRVEKSYLNYHLNNTEFGNGPCIRNKYSHGTQSRQSLNEEHECNYFIILKLLILIIFKVIDDLYIFPENKNANDYFQD